MTTTPRLKIFELLKLAEEAITRGQYDDGSRKQAELYIQLAETYIQNTTTHGTENIENTYQHGTENTAKHGT